jgi:hypothetical protein
VERKGGGGVREEGGGREWRGGRRAVEVPRYTLFLVLFLFRASEAHRYTRGGVKRRVRGGR